MIGWLSGVLQHRSDDRAIVNAGGVGYEVQLAPATLASLGAVGERVELFIHTHVQEDALVLFGFLTPSERELFVHLTKVSGIGPKSAIGLLSKIPSDRLIDAIRTGNSSLLQSVPGIGRKTAERLVVELKDRLRSFAIPTDRQAGPARPAGSSYEDVISALMNLGYKRFAAEEALSTVDLSKSPSFDSLLKETLKVLAK